MASIITSLERADPKRYLNHPPLSTLKKRKTREVFLLDDLSGSGQRVISFINAMRRHKTITSWCSSQLLRFHLVAYSITKDAESAVLSEFCVRNGKYPRINIQFTCAKRPGIFLEMLSDAEQERLKQLCLCYGKIAKLRRSEYLGFKNSLVNLVFAHGCPNNVPGILWKNTNDWTALFPNRTIPDALRERLFRQSRTITKGKGAPSRPLASTSVTKEPIQIDLIRLMELLRIRVKGEDRLTDALEISLNQLEDLLTIGREYGLIDNDCKLTETGRGELLRYKRRCILTEKQSAREQSFYIPKQLRGPKGTV